MDARALAAPSLGTLDSLLGMGLGEHVQSQHRFCSFNRGYQPFSSTFSRASAASSEPAVPQNLDLPPVLPKNRKKPFVVPPKRGGFMSNKGPKKPLEDFFSPPGNGLLVSELIPVAHAVYEARETLLYLVSKLMEVVPVKACMFCDHSHIGPVGHEIRTCGGHGSDTRHSRHVWTDGRVSDVISNLDAYHYDRFKLIRHEMRRGLKRIPAVVELCIQAGVDLPEYPVLRRRDPVRVSGRKIVEADELFLELPQELDFSLTPELRQETGPKPPVGSSNAILQRGDPSVDTSDGGGGIRQNTYTYGEGTSPPSPEEAKEIAEAALRLWEVMRSGTEKLMKRYTVRACGYCPEVNIGPRGHMVRLCGAFKHQWRQGKHGWQVAGLDDLIPPKYVWHVPDLTSPLLLNEMKRFYGQTPAIVELCVQAGADVPPKYRPRMRLDVVAPTTPYEADRVV